jgi:cytoskeleton protein RodZ
MSDAPIDKSAGPAPTTAGGMLRRARQAQGLHIAALSAAIKVLPRKLEALESDRYGELPDATFTRALAQAVCRSLKIDAAPVLALLPPPNGHRLEQVSEGLKTPFHERPGRLRPHDGSGTTRPALWIAALIVVAAVVMYLLPPGWLPGPASSAVRRAAAPAGAGSSTIVVEPLGAGASVPDGPSASGNVAAGRAGDGSSPASSAGGALPLPASADGAPALAGATAASPPAAAASLAEAVPAATALQFTTRSAAWLGVTDANGKPLIGRLVQPGENVVIDGALPLKVRIGNAGATRLVFRGQSVELARFARNDVAQLELK